MKTSLEPTLKFTLQHEGGYSSCRADPGNWTGGRVGSGQLVGTKYGLSAPLLVRDRGLCVTAQMVRLLTVDDFHSLATRHFWNVMHCGDLPAGVDALVFDHGFNAGVGPSVRLLQQVVGVDQDGSVGPHTLKAIQNMRVADVGRYASSTMISELQKGMGVTATGSLDQLTITLVEKHGLQLKLLCYALTNQQLNDYRRKRDFTVFGEGWLRRARERFQLATDLLTQNHPALT